MATGDQSSDGHLADSDTPTLRAVDQQDDSDFGTDWTATVNAEPEPDPGAGADVWEDTAAENAPKKPDRSLRIILIGLAVAVVIVIVGIWMLVRVFSGAGQTSDTSADVPTRPAEGVSTEVDLANEVTSAGQCESSAPEISAGTDSPQAAIAAFQTAYYSADAKGIKDALSTTSPLQEQDWPEVVKQAKDSTFCVIMQPTTGDEVDAKLTVTDPDGKQVSYDQRVVTEKTTDGYKVSEIKAKE